MPVFRKTEELPLSALRRIVLVLFYIRILTHTSSLLRCYYRNRQNREMRLFSHFIATYSIHDCN